MIKNFTLIAFSCFFLTFINSCKKEPSGSTNPGGTSIYFFNGTPGTCTAPTIAGFYSVGIAMNASNTITITVNVTVKGTYSMNTTASNGVWFSGNGTFAGTGPQTVVLTGNGTPIKAGIFPFVPVTSNTCNFSVSFLNGPPAAVFTYAGAPSACTAPAISGGYGIGVALGSANYVDLAVNVTSPGAYTVSTNSANGISFSGSGAFTANGAQVIRLIGNGTPTSSGSFAYTPTGGCSFNINVTTAGGTSIYTLDCSTPVVAGTYTAGSPLGAGNTITIKANVTTAGTYSMSTGPVNGMTFSTSGTFAVGPNQTIVLTGSGTPAAAGANSFTVIGSGCTIPITIAAPPPAVFTLTCSGTAVSGSYVVGTALTASNKVDVEVNVATAGAYTITSNTVNGMTFSKTGVFSSAGIITVTLIGSGTPGIAGPSSFTVGTAACPFSVTVTAPTSPCSGLTVNKFTIAGQYSISGVPIGFDIGTGFQYTMQEGFISVQVTFPGNTPPAPGTYSVGTVTIHTLGADARDWNGVSGSIYVSATTIEFCNVNIRGISLVPGGGTINSTCEAKMQ